MYAEHGSDQTTAAEIAARVERIVTGS